MVNSSRKGDFEQHAFVFKNTSRLHVFFYIFNNKNLRGFTPELSMLLRPVDNSSKTIRDSQKHLFVKDELPNGSRKTVVKEETLMSLKSSRNRTQLQYEVTSHLANFSLVTSLPCKTTYRKDHLACQAEVTIYSL